MSNLTQIDVTYNPPHATVLFNTEGGLNVMSGAVLDRLGEVVAELAERKDVRFCTLKADGKVFIAGANIKEMADFTPLAARDLSVRGNKVMDALEMLPCITVAAIHGAALGGGCEIALACDFRIATNDAKIGLPETNLGLFPGWGGIGRMARLCGLSAARKLVFSGVPISAEEARKVRLVDHVSETSDKLEQDVAEFFETFNRGGPRAIGLAKRVLSTGEEFDAFADCFAGDEAREGMKAFMEKRPPAWMKTD